MRNFLLIPSLLAFAALIQPSRAAEDPGKEALEKFVGTIRQASITGDTAGLVKIARGIFPNRESLKKALSDHVPDASIDKLENWFQTALTASDEDCVKVFGIKESESLITAHAATVEDLIANAQGTAAYLHFPKGIHPFAHDGTLRDSTTFYEVIVSEPGPQKPYARRFDIMFWDGEAWKMLGGIWSVLQAETPLIAPPIGAPAEAQRLHLKNLNERLDLYQETAKKAEADLATAMADIENNSDPDSMEDLINRSLVASKLLLAMQTKIPKLETQIKRQNITASLFDMDFGKLTGFDQILPAAPKVPAKAPEDQLALLKKELHFLGIAKAGTAKALADPTTLTRDELIKLTSELLEVDQLITAKQQQIATLEAKLAAKK